MSKVYLDCDTGIDDALAIAYLLAHPEVELLGIGTVSGNIDAGQGARNTLDLLALTDRARPPVAVGSWVSLTGVDHGGAARVHGSNGVGGIEMPAAADRPIAGDAAGLLVELARAHPGELEVLATGPCTNLALALQLEPKLPELVRRVVVMGGAALVAGNVTPVAEANIWHDPEAAQVVLAAGWPVVLVPLDVTMNHRLDEPEVAALAASDHPLLQALAAMIETYLDFYAGVFGYRTCTLHDPLAAGILTGEAVPTLAPAIPVAVDTTAGPGRGQTIVDLRRLRIEPQGRAAEPVQVVLEVAEPYAPQLMARLDGYRTD